MANTSRPDAWSNNADFQYPGQWGQAADTWSNMASGNYSNAGMDWLKNMFQSGGNPVDVNAWGAARRPAMMDEYSNMVKQMAEQAGVGGVRYGSGLQNSISNYGGQLQNQYNQDLADRWMSSQESARGRALSGASQYGQLGLGAQTTGGQGLMQSGWDYANLPMQVGDRMAAYGQSLTNQQIDPWTQMLAQYGGSQQAAPQTYTPSGLQSGFQSAAQMMPWTLDSWDKQGWWGGQ